MVQIRKYKLKDFSVIREWWGTHKAAPTIPEMLPEETTYIAESDGVAIAALSLLLTNNKYACMAEHLIADPSVSKPLRKEAVDKLFSHIEGEAKRFGYIAIVLFSYVEGLKKRYEGLGYFPTLSNVTTFAKLI